MMALPGGRRVWGGRGREGERESMDVFCKECLMTKRTLCNFLCWVGSLGGKVVMSVKNERLYDMYGYERVFLICWKKRKRKTIMKRKNRPTHETVTKSSIITKNPHSSISLATKQKNLNHHHHQFHILATFQQQQQQSPLTLLSPPYKSPLFLTSTHNAGFSQTKKTF